MIRNIIKSKKSVSLHRNLSRVTQGFFKLPKVENEPFLHYPPGSNERAALKNAINDVRNECPDIPCIVGGKEIRTGNVKKQVAPSDHQHTVCTYHEATEDVVQQAIDASMKAKQEWEAMDYQNRMAIFMRAADLLATKYRPKLCAATMVGQGKNVWQAEIDAAVETIDFWRIGTHYVQELYNSQPAYNPKANWNRLEYRPLEGFVLAITPFNFTAIGANLPSAPAMMGNTCVWKPSSTSTLSNYYTYKILEEAGLPAGVINFLPGSGRMIARKCFGDSDFGGIHFTGSTETFQDIWLRLAENLPNYKTYPRIVGETGGKNFHFIHSSASDQIDNIVNNTLRGAFEYQGQKCSATSRMYVPKSLWPQIKEGLVNEVNKIKMGQPDDFSVFMTGVIDKASFDKCKSYIEHANSSSEAQVIVGGECDDSKGYFVQPTIIETTNPHYKSMEEEIFGPILSVYVYNDSDYAEALNICDKTSQYALTGSIFASDRYALEEGVYALRNAAGNFYINDKSTGSIVGQQPFGGARGSGTNDKAGFVLNYTRWTSARSIKENFLPTQDWRYPSMKED